MNRQLLVGLWIVLSWWSIVCTAEDKADAGRFIVAGRITDQEGRGMEGVRVMAHCGAGTLLPTGETHSRADGSYTLHFRPGMLTSHGGKPRTAFQAATIHPSKQGYAEENLHRDGNLMMADELPDAEGLRAWGAKTNRIVLKDQPYRLDFVMIPAGRFDGRLMNKQGKPLANERIEIVGSELPPSSSVLAASRTGPDGKFEFANVPVKREWWFELPDKEEARSSPVKLAEASTEKFDLTLNKAGGKHSLEVRKR